MGYPTSRIFGSEYWRKPSNHKNCQSSIYFFNDAYRYFKIELKNERSIEQKRFHDGSKGMLNEKADGDLGHLVDKETAYKMLTECVYEPTEENKHVLKPDNEVMAWVKYLLMLSLNDYNR